MNNFFIMGNGSSGTTFLAQMLNSHSEIEMVQNKYHEHFNKDFGHSLKQYQEFAQDVNGRGLVWGVKLPFEQVIFRNSHWHIGDYFTLSSNFKIIYMFREFEHWMRSWNARQLPELDEETAKKWHSEGYNLYKRLYTTTYNRVMKVEYKDLCDEPKTQMESLCNFLGVKYEDPQVLVKKWDVTLQK